MFSDPGEEVGLLSPGEGQGAYSDSAVRIMNKI